MEPKYLRDRFEGFTHRFIVEFSVDDDWRNNTKLDIYSNSDSYQSLEEFIDSKKSDKVKSFKIIDRASKEQDEESSKFIEEWLNSSI
jgi:hypothetical protein